MMTKEGPTKIVNFMTPWNGVLMKRCGHISHYKEYALSFTISMQSILFAIVLIKGIIMLLSNVIVDFHLF